MLSPRDLKRSPFSKTLKGYSVNEVDEYVRFILSKYNEAYNEYIELQQKYTLVLSELESAKSEENAISATIVNAQKMADAIVGDAKKRADEIKGAVSDSCDRILDAYMTKVTAEREKLAECEEVVAKFKNSLYEAYKKHLELIDNIMPDEEPTPYLSDEELEEKAIELVNEKISSGTESVEQTAVEESSAEQASDDTSVDTAE